MSFFFNDTATTEIYTLSLHDALPIFVDRIQRLGVNCRQSYASAIRTTQKGLCCKMPQQNVRHFVVQGGSFQHIRVLRSEEHTSELQSRQYLVCRLLLEKKKHLSSFPP